MLYNNYCTYIYIYNLLYNLLYIYNNYIIYYYTYLIYIILLHYTQIIFQRIIILHTSKILLLNLASDVLQSHKLSFVFTQNTIVTNLRVISVNGCNFRVIKPLPTICAQPCQTHVAVRSTMISSLAGKKGEDEGKGKRRN